MTAQEYFVNWTQPGEEVSPISLYKLQNLHLQPSTISYLKAGLPKDAAPYISFVKDSDDLYERIAKLEDQYDIDLELNKYVVIGSDGNGSPIAVNVQSNDTIEWLNHEAYFAPSYCNKSLECLLAFLIIYRDFVNDAINNKGENALFDANFTDEQYNFMKQRMLTVDNVAVNEQGFWKEELDRLMIELTIVQTPNTDRAISIRIFSSIYKTVQEIILITTILAHGLA